MSEKDQFELFAFKVLQPLKQEIEKSFTLSSVNNFSFVPAPQNNGTNLIKGFEKHKPKSEKKMKKLLKKL